MSIAHLRVLSLNPFMIGKIIQNFLEGYNKPADFKLLFYILPIVLYKDSRDKLSSANSRSRLDTVFGKKYGFLNSENKELMISGKANISGFIDRFNNLRNLTKQSLIILSNENKIMIGSNVILIEKDKYDNYSGNIYPILRAAFYLGVIFSKTSQDYLDSFLGVKST